MEKIRTIWKHKGKFGNISKICENIRKTWKNKDNLGKYKDNFRKYVKTSFFKPQDGFLHPSVIGFKKFLNVSYPLVPFFLNINQFRKQFEQITMGILIFMN